ncbi:MAG: hypothetical protein A2Z02_00645 [Chloroflexi bacterium RBG_16_48_7]|nr:MAG: hypothetical protein A2Z02_00645 [Chloroflexi bacterium RBG_16_48_7]
MLVIERVKAKVNKVAYLGLLLLLPVLLFEGCSSLSGESPAASPVPVFPTSGPVTPATTTLPETTNRVDLAYFHPKRRCALCLNIEVQTKSFLDKNYKDQLASGKLTFTSYELEDKNNSVIVKKYGALSSQLFINTIVVGKENIQHLEKVWLPEVYDDSTAFSDYLSSVISKSLEAIK